MNKKIFDLHYQYRLYLEKVGVTEEQLSPVQNQELKRAFFGACGQLLYLAREEIPELDDETAVNTLEDMWQQVGGFWKEEIRKEQRQN